MTRSIQRECGGSTPTRCQKRYKWKSVALAVAVELGFSASVDAQALGRIYVFGDSSADLGTQGPDRRPTNVGPMWSEAFASALGRRLEPAIDLTGAAIRFTGGTSYAINGSTAVRYDGVPTFSDQLDLFESNGGRFGHSDLVFTWFTRNDITTAFVEGREYSPADYVERYLESIERAQSLGARNIVAFGAEIGLLADALGIDNGFPPEALELLRENTRITESQLWPRLSAANVFIIDINRLGDAIVSEPQRYGFSATTDSYQGRGGDGTRPEQSYPNDGNVFTAGGHFTSQMQVVVSDFTMAQLRARDDYGQSLAVFAQQHESSLTAFSRRLAAENQRGWAPFASVAGRATTTDARGGLGRELKGTGNSFQIGALRAEAGWAIGAGIDVRRSLVDAGSSFRADRKDWSVSAGAKWDLSQSLRLVGGLAYSDADFEEIARKASLGAASESAVGTTDGSLLSGSLALAHSLKLGDSWMLDSTLGLETHRLKSDGYSEADGVLSLSYGNVDWRWTRAVLGVDLAHVSDDSRWDHFVSASYSSDVSNDTKALSVGPQQNYLANYEFARGRGYGWTVGAGVGLKLADSTRLQFGLSLVERTVGDDAPRVRDSSANLRLVVGL